MDIKTFFAMIGRISAETTLNIYSYITDIKIQKSGTGYITMINTHLYEGRFTPIVNGNRISKNVYAKT